MPPREFICRFPGCQASYQRKEHLGRHQVQHIQRQSYQCPICNRQFGRNDTLRRHLRRTHAVDEPAPSAKQACANCRNIKSRCEGAPCSECIRRRIPCSLSRQVEVNRNRDGSLSRLTDRPPTPSHDIRPGFETRFPNKEVSFLSLYFKLFHPYWPFIHRGSFNESYEAPLLVQSMIVIGLWASEEQNAQSAAIDLHNVLDSAIRQQREVWDASAAEDACSACSWPIPTYQAILLHIMFPLLYRGRAPLDLGLKPSLSSADTDLLGALIVSCKRLGMLYYPNILSRFCQDDHAPFVWVSVEEVKRYNLALYKVCNALSRSSKDDINVEEYGPTGAASSRITAGDLQFPLPRNNLLWNAVNKEEWDSAATEVYRPSLDDTMEEEWISRSAKVLQLVGT